jgi:hypothetical protein
MFFDPIGHSTHYWAMLDKVCAVAAFIAVLIAAVGWKRR